MKQTLSDKRIEYINQGNVEFFGGYKEQDLKEALKELLHSVDIGKYPHLRERAKEIFGERLIKSKED